MKPLGRFVGTQVKGCAPDEMGISPIYAIPALLKWTGVELRDVDIIELNEAFASQTIACIRELGLDEDKVNPNGGAIALGHPPARPGHGRLPHCSASCCVRTKRWVSSACARVPD